MSGFGWSTGDVVLAGKLISKIMKALKDTGGARDDYQQSVQFLSGLEGTLQNIAAAESMLPPTAAAQDTIQQTERIITALSSLLEDARKFEKSLGATASQGKVGQTTSKLKWTFRQAKAVKHLEDKISVPLATVNTNIGMQILELVKVLQTSLPTSICDVLSARIDATIPDRLRTELEPLSRAIDAQASASTSFMRNLTSNNALQFSAQQAMRDSLTESMTRFQADMHLLQASVQGNSTTLDCIRVAVSPDTTRALVPRQLVEPRERISQSLWIMTTAINELLLAFLELTWPVLLLFLRKFQITGSLLSRLLIGDSFIFEDALGRTRYLPFEFFQHWDVFLPYLHKTFEQVPGLYNITRRRYHLVDSRTGNIIDPQKWRRQVRPGSRLSMAMVAFKVSSGSRACPHCGCSQTWTGPDTFATCGDYRLFEPGTRQYITPSDGQYGLGGLNAVKTSNVAWDKPQWPTLTFPILTRPLARVTDIKDDFVPTKSLRLFKKVDILLVNDPARILTILEELLEVVHHFRNLKVFIDDKTESDLRAYIQFARFELEQPINIFDFEPWGLDDSGNAINQLQSFVDDQSTLPNNVVLQPVCFTLRGMGLSRFAPSIRQKLMNGTPLEPQSTVLLLIQSLVRKLMLRVALSMTIKEIKGMICTSDGLPESNQCLVYLGKKLEDDRSVGDYKLSTQNYIHLVLQSQINSGYYYDGPLPSWLLRESELSSPQSDDPLPSWPLRASEFSSRQRDAPLPSWLLCENGLSPLQNDALDGIFRCGGYAVPEQAFEAVSDNFLELVD